MSIIIFKNDKLQIRSYEENKRDTYESIIKKK